MNHASKYPCLYCIKYKNENGEWIGSSELRTWQSIVKNKSEWLTIGQGKKNTRQQFFNCVNDPLIGDGSDQPILDSVPPPPLHLKLALNSILDSLLNVWPELEIWTEMLHLVFAPYHGMVLEGNQCEKFLKHLEAMAEWIPADFEEYLVLLRSFKSVLDSCCRATGLSEDYKACLDSFRDAALDVKDKFDMSIIPKLHVIIDHVGYYCDKYQVSLGRYSEQELEACHSTFDKMWRSQFMMKNPKDPKYGPQLLKCVLTYVNKNS